MSDESRQVGGLSARSLGWLAGMHVLQFAVLAAWALRAVYCCDAGYYLTSSERLFADGLMYEDIYAGYRSYFVPFVLGAINRLLGFVGSDYPLRAALVFTVLSFAASAAVLRTESLRRYLAFAVPLLFNPFLVIYTLYPLQEGVLMLLGLPLLLLALAPRHPSPLRTFATLFGFVALAYIVRPSLVWLVIPTAAALAVDVYRRRAEWSRLTLLKAVALAIVIVVPLLAPQMVLASKRFGTLNPYPASDSLVGSQLAWGIEMLKYGTLADENLAWQGLRYDSPFKNLPAEAKRASFYIQQPAAGAVMALAHVWSGLHYDVLQPYVRVSQLRWVSPWLVLSALVVCLGLLGLVERVRERSEPVATTWLAMTLVLSCGYTAFVAVEARFGLLGFAALSVFAVTLPMTESGRRRMRDAAPLAFAYVLASVLLNALMLATTPVL